MQRLCSVFLLSLVFVCTGCSPIFDLEGTVSGLEDGTLLLSDGNLNVVEITADGTFSFSPAQYQAGDQYTVTIESQPQGLECRVANYQGTFTNVSVRNIEVICTPPEVVINSCGNPQTETEYTLADTQVALGTGLGATGFSQFDADDDGYPEILFGSGWSFGPNNKFAIYEFDTAQGTYSPRCESSYTDDTIQQIIPFENAQYNAASLIALNSGRVEVLNHRTGEKLASFETGLTHIADVLVVDADNDEALEVVILAAEGLMLIDADTFTMKMTLPYAAEAMAAGHFTQSENVELALNTGLVLAIVGDEVSLAWDYSVIGFSNQHLQAGDVDNDGLDEIIGADAWQAVRVFNADTLGILWEVFPRHDVDALTVTDVTNDGIPEVLYGDGQWGDVHALIGLTGEELWVVDNPEHGVTNILVADLDQDAQLELLWGAGYSSTGEDYLYVYDIVSSTVDWQSENSAGPYYALAFGDIDGDGVEDRIYAAQESQETLTAGVVTVIGSAGNNSVLWRSYMPRGDALVYNGFHALAVQDVNSDGINDVIVAGDRSGYGALYFLNGVDGSVMDYIALDSRASLYSIALADMNGDGSNEILAGGGKESTGTTGTFVYQFSGDGTGLEYSSPSLGDDWVDIWSLETFDINGDGDLEILAVKGGVFIIDTEINALNRTQNTNFRSLAVTSNLAYVGDDMGNLYTLGVSGTSSLIGALCISAVDALEAISDSRLAFTCGGRLGIYDLSTATVAWQTVEPVDATLGYHDSLKHGVVNGRSALLVGGSTVRYFLR